MPSKSIINRPLALNKDSDERLLSPEEMSDALNVRGISGEDGKGFILKTIRGNLIKNYTLPTGTNTVIGAIPVEDVNKLYYFVSNSNNDHSILEYDSINDTITKVLENSILNFQTTNTIQGRGMILENGDTLLYFTDDLNPVRKINVQKAIDHTLGLSTGYPSPLTEEYIEVLKYPPVNKPEFVFATDTDQAINNVAGKMFQFAYRYVYDDGEVSAYSPYSDVAISDYYLQNSVYTASQIDSNNNVITLTLDNGSAICDSIEVIFREGNDGEWKRIRRVENNPLASTQDLNFNNNGNYQVADPTDTNKLFDNVPITAKATEIIGNKLVLGNYVDGYDNVDEVSTSNLVTVVPNYSERTDYENGTAPSVTHGVYSPASGADGAFANLDFSLYTPSGGDLVSISVKFSVISSGADGFLQASGIVYTDYTVGDGESLSTVLTNIANQIIGNIYGGIVVSSDTDVSGGNTLRIRIFPRPRFEVASVLGTPTITDNSFYTEGGSAQRTFKAGANHPIGIVYYDRGNRSTTVQKVSDEGIYVKFFSERDGTAVEGLGKTSLDFRIGTTPPEWATHYKLVYSGNTTVDEFLQYTCLNSYKPIANNPALSPITEARIYLSFRGFKGKPDSYKERLGAEIDYNFQEGDRLRIISYYNPDSSSRQFPKGYLDFKILGLETYDETNSPILDQSVTATAVIYNRTGTFLIIEDSGIDGWKFSDVEGANDFWYNTTAEEGAYFEIYRPYAPPENEVYYEIGEEYAIANAGESNRSHEGNIRNQGGIINYTVTAVNSATAPTYIDVNEPFETLRLVNGDFIQVSGSIVTRGLVRKTEYVSATDSRIYFDFEAGDGVTVSDIVSLSTGEDVAASRIDGGDVWMKPRLLRKDGTYNTLDNYIDVAEDYYANDFLPTNSWNKGRPNAFSENSKQVNRYQTITWSDSFFTDTNDNGFSSFNTALANFKELQNGYGSIQLLRRRGDELVSYQEDRVSKILVNKDILFTPEGSSTVSISNNFVSEPSYYAGDYGIGLNPESFAEEDGRHYWVSAKRGKVLRLGGDGITKISDYGMRSYFDDTLSSYLPSIATAKIFGGYDRDNQEYYTSIPTGIDTVTVSFSEQANKWISRWSFQPDFYSGINMKFISFKDGALYVHDANPLHSNFYGVQHSASFSITVNENPQVVKTFRACELQSNKAWDCITVETNLVSSLIPEANFVEKEGFYYAEFLKATINNNDAPFVGLGTVSAINSNTVTITGFDKESVDVMIGDSFYTGGTLIGTVVTIGDGTLELSAVAGLSVSDFVYLIKENSIQGDKIAGYYAKMTFTQDDSSYSEIFAIRNWVNVSELTID